MADLFKSVFQPLRLALLKTGDLNIAGPLAALMLITLTFSPANAQVIEGHYAGDESCKKCHLNIYKQYRKTGHPYKIQRLEGSPPVYPANTSPGVPHPPADKSWDDISYVIGGFQWKARFMDNEGYILTGKANRQYNLANDALETEAKWSGYDAGKAPRKPYTCGGCHTTGWEPTGQAGPHQDNLPGIHGTWAAPGVTCEACHGPGAKHVTEPKTVKLSISERCEDCHVRGDVNRIDAKDGLIKHHEQYEDLLASPHRALKCVACHDPHKSVFNDNGGFKGAQATCLTCHKGKEIKLAKKSAFECITCHMPRAAKSAMAVQHKFDGGAVMEGDIRTHIFRITRDPEWEMFTEDGKYVETDDDGKVFITLDRACLSCHKKKNLDWARKNATRIHNDN